MLHVKWGIAVTTVAETTTEEVIKPFKKLETVNVTTTKSK